MTQYEYIGRTPLKITRNNKKVTMKRGETYNLSDTTMRRYGQKRFKKIEEEQDE